MSSNAPSEESTESTPISFADLGLSAPVLAALSDVGYETPTAIQAATIPHFMAGRDLIGQAQTGTGKTAAFALPLLTRIDLERAVPQVLVLAPTRELAIQVAEAFHSYAAHLPGFHVLPIYGGQDYGVQLRGLRRGVHVVVGTPGRVMDHMRRGTLDLRALTCLVLDEGDEMLRMGFIDDVEWVLEQTPPERQVALFSATMPPPIRKIAERYMREPQEISIRLSTTTAATIRQRYWVVSGLHKLDALTRILETENYEGVLIFVRTKLATVELAERLDARGYSCAAISGDVAQKVREKTIEQLKDGKLDILVATDVAARGLDVERISHVINFDIPNDSEVYVHRIGRTGRAGRHGDAILFVAPREQHMLRVIERATRQPIERMDLPSTEMVNDKRIGRFMQAITDTLASAELDVFAQLVDRYQREHDVEPAAIAAALAHMVQGGQPLLIEPQHRGERHERGGRDGQRSDTRPLRPEGARWEKHAPPRGERGYEHRPAPRDHEARPVRTENDGPRRFDEQRPRFGAEAPPHRERERPPFGNADRSPRRDEAGPPRYADNRPPRRDEAGPPRYSDTRPPRREEAGQSRFSDARPPRRDDASPPRFNDDRPPRRDDGSPARYNNERPPRNVSERQDGDRPPRFRPAEGPARGDGERPPRFGAERGPNAAERRPFQTENRPPRAAGEEGRSRLGVRTPPPPGMEGFRLEVGHSHGVQAGNIVGAIANEAGIDSRDIGRIQIHDDYATVDLPIGMPNEMLAHLKRVWVAGQQLQISRLGDPTAPRRTDRVRDKDHKKDRHRDRKNKGAPKGPARRP